MSSMALEEVKRELYVRYEAELTALLESEHPSADTAGKHGDANDYPPQQKATDGEDATACEDDEEGEKEEREHPVVSQLRVSYPRQRLLCQRALRQPSRVILHGGRGDTAAESERDTTAALNAMRWRALYSLAAPQTTESDTVTEDSEEAWCGRKQVMTEDQLRRQRQMHGLQEAAVKQLRQTLLEQAKSRSVSPPSCAPSAAQRTPCADEAEDEAQLPPPDAASEPRDQSHGDVIAFSDVAILEKGGVHGEPFLQRRLAILESLENQLREERVDALALGMW